MMITTYVSRTCHGVGIRDVANRTEGRFSSIWLANRVGERQTNIIFIIIFVYVSACVTVPIG